MKQAGYSDKKRNEEENTWKALKIWVEEGKKLFSLVLPPHLRSLLSKPRQLFLVSLAKLAKRQFITDKVPRV